MQLPSQTFSSTTDGLVQQLIVGDVNHDGKLDLLIGYNKNSEWAHRRMFGSLSHRRARHGIDHLPLSRVLLEPSAGFTSAIAIEFLLRAQSPMQSPTAHKE